MTGIERNGRFAVTGEKPSREPFLPDQKTNRPPQGDQTCGGLSIVSIHAVGGFRMAALLNQGKLDFGVRLLLLLLHKSNIIRAGKNVSYGWTDEKGNHAKAWAFYLEEFEKLEGV